ncbi:insulinase family protein [Steroidobacter sp. S1-65]|uniref:Insulinase family protein n=1 Tax=Steroidobacter gossypii TaxID=2805490 RepID=A0ABS1WSL4_9GAMM|nr:pitrilysin family protein [Steroidobacter gossypii]MBM0103954.1 insulinase family protein [Steroidobacter gossypii]
MQRAWFSGVGLCLAFALLPVAAATAATTAAVRVDFSEHTLKNGLRVQLVEDRTTPVIAVNVAYDVGSRNERPGLTGFAHLFEHMMFKGSKNVGDGEHFYQVFTNGGSMNGTTSADITLYFEALPANQLELALFLEADRMRSLEITQAKLDNQRQAVQEERRMRVDNQPYGRSYERFDELFYDNFGYQHSTIGSMEDLNAASVEDVAEFFRIYYAPNNAVLSVVGDFKRDDALALIRKYFEDIPRQPAPPPVDLIDPPQKAERRETLTDPLARAAQLLIGYKGDVGNGPDQAALQVLSSVLQSGDSSRLYQTISKEKELVTGIGGYVEERIGTGGFYITATVRPDRKPEEVEAAIYEEISRIVEHPIADWELQKARNATRMGYLQSIRSAQNRARILGTYTILFRDPHLINTRLAKIEAVTRADVQRVAKKYLQPTNRTVLTTLPAPAAAPTPTPGP